MADPAGHALLALRYHREYRQLWPSGDGLPYRLRDERERAMAGPEPTPRGIHEDGWR